MWKAWTGFNASHSSGAIYIGIINLGIAIQYDSVLRSPAFLFLNVVTGLFYCWLAKTYWFRIPLIGISLGTACFIISTALFLSG